MLISADRVFTGHQFIDNATVEVLNDRIVAVYPSLMAGASHFQGTLTAGFIDYHVNGGGGKLFNFEPELATLQTMVKAHSQFGSTALLPTLITDELSVMSAAADAVTEAMNCKTAGILGIHFEGPHLSVPKKGVHPEKHIRAIDAEEMALFKRGDLGIKLITLAPENVSDDDINQLLTHKVKVSIGHTNASFERVQQVLAFGADGFTHLYNAMSPLTSREPGVVGAALTADSAYCGIILDGHHMHYQSALLAYKAKPQGKLLLVTDAMSTIGSEQNQFKLFGEQVMLEGDKLATVEGTLAGSALDMITAVKNAVVHLGIELAEALNMASLYPAQYLNVEQDMGSIEVGKLASMTVFNEQFEVLATWLEGNPIYQKQ